VIFAMAPTFKGENWILVPAAMVAILGALVLAFRFISRIEDTAQRSDAVFERSGISLWREDWSAVGKALIELRKAGISDVQAYFTARPDLARSLRHQVLIRDVNDFTVQMMGATSKEAFIGPLDRILPDTDPTFLQWIVAFANGDSFYRSEAHIARPDGSVIDTLFTAELPTDFEGFHDIIVTCIDITGYRSAQALLVAAETELARASRVTTVGALTASIAHEVNSPLAAIVSNAEACLRWLRRPMPDLAEAEAAITAVVADATRARDVVERTRSFLSNSPRRSSPIDLAATVRDATLLVERELRAHGISVHFDAEEHLPPVLADPIQIQQVLVNLMLNAAQAMSGLDGPRDLTITLYKSDEDVRVNVQDNGIGIAAELADSVFKPFFTTKPDGIGMGLAICRNCVEAHGGRIWLTSVAGAGATFHIMLPAMKP
jgi:signal transduction histidine kinase